ncbi:MAG TPA: hypothetical protein VLV89_05450 [Candidatus Acidoferrum sp.]|nr:hypothetical protein [Candidatus Acidoferrum sp.]
MPSKSNVNPGMAGGLAAMRRELANAELQVRQLAAKHGDILAQRERDACADALESCGTFDSIRPRATARLAEIREGVVLPGRKTPERFLGEARLAEMALREADLADASYTILAFANARDQARYIRGGAERDAVLRETMKRGGVYNDRKYFMGIVRM